MTVLGFAPDQFGQGWICLFRILKAEAPICVGGSQQLALGLRRALEAHGGVVRTDTEVKRILLRGNRATGMELNDGTRVEAGKAVVTNVEPKKSFLGWLEKSFCRPLRHSRQELSLEAGGRCSSCTWRCRSRRVIGPALTTRR